MTIKIDPRSPTWLSVKAYVDERMSSLRSQLELNISHEETLRTRAKLQELKDLIAETQVERPLIEVEDFELPS